MPIQFGNIEEVALTEIWSNEATDFTPWLASNIDQLAAVLGLELEIIKTEAAVGDFSCDILARDLGSRRLVVIENQIKPANHDHLGKLITYAAGLGAEAIVWVAKKLRDEHRQALEWLNEHTRTGTDFWGVEIKVIRIDDSKPAYQFQVVTAPFESEKVDPVSPSDDGDDLPISERYRRYFQQLVDDLRETHHFTNARVAQPQNWYSFSSGVSGLPYVAAFMNRNRATVQLAIQFGSREENEALFDCLFSQKEAIERDLGATENEMSWQRMEGRQMSRIIASIDGSIREDTEALSAIHNWMVSRLLKFKEVFGPRLRPALQHVQRHE